MASESVAGASPEFGGVSVLEKVKRKKSRLVNDENTFDGLFSVCGGDNIDEVINRADCLADSVRALVGDSVESGMSSEVAYLVEFVMEAIHGLLESVELPLREACSHE